MAVNVGNPHLVFFVEDATRRRRWSRLGPRIEHDPAFPERINVNVASRQRPTASACAPGSAAPA
jgi:diaminopimelate epimerase